jgi:hypothetical protein
LLVFFEDCLWRHTLRKTSIEKSQIQNGIT